MMIFGRLMDRYGEKYVIGLSALLLGLTAALLPFASSYTTLLIGVFIVGLFYGSAHTGGSTVITKWFPNEHRTHDQSILYYYGSCVIWAFCRLEWSVYCLLCCNNCLDAYSCSMAIIAYYFQQKNTFNIT